MIRFLRKGEGYAFSRPIAQYFYLPIKAVGKMLTVVLIFCFQFVCLAQESRESGAMSSTEEIKPLRIGDTVSNSARQVTDISTILAPKKEFVIIHDLQAPIGAYTNGLPSENYLYQSVLSKYQNGLRSQLVHANPAFIDGKYSVNNGTLFRVGCYNSNLLDMYRLAFFNGKQTLGHNRVLLEVEDPIKLTINYSGQEYEDWLKENGYCYELIMPIAVGRKAVYERMRSDLKMMFPQYESKIEKRNIECLVLVRTSALDKLKSAGGKAFVDWDYFGFQMRNSYGINYLIGRLAHYLQKESPIIDKTGYNGIIDIDIQARMTDVEDLNRELAKYDLALVREYNSIDMLVIKDSGKAALDFDLNQVDFDTRTRGFDWNPLQEGRDDR